MISCVLICISLMINDVGYLFVCLLAICMSSLENVCLDILSSLISCLFVSLLSCIELASCRIYDVLSFPPIQHVVFLFCCWIICVVQRLFSLIEFFPFIFIFVAFAFAIRSKKKSLAKNCVKELIIFAFF